MKQKDITEKLLEEYEDVFADIMNGLVFDGKFVVNPSSLEAAPTLSQYKADDSKLHEMERDVVKLWRDKKVNIALYGIENQTKAEKIMPLRILGYDGTAYRSQLLKKKTGKLYPVVTIVLYFGWTAHWNQPKSLKKVLQVPKELDKYVNDYAINVFEIAWLSDEQVKKFKSDFRIVADFFTQMRKNKTYKPSTQEIKHVDAVLKMLSTFGHVDKFEAFVASGKSKEVSCMNAVIDRMENAALERGRVEGINEGISVGINALIATLRELKKSNEYIIQTIVDKFNITEAEAQKYL